jgi:G3E family GTPase
VGAVLTQDEGVSLLVDHIGSEDASDPVPVMVLTGFLGAGKTTLLNRILLCGHGLRVAVLVNDFGDINIDGDLVAGVRAGVISLANGCVCCSIRDDLIETVMAALDLPEQPEYIVLEASGVAEPTGIATTLMLPDFRSRIRLDSITCVLDAEQVFEVPELMELKIWQAAFADLLVLNKVDLVDRAQVDRVRAWLDSRMHRYRLVQAARCDAMAAMTQVLIKLIEICVPELKRHIMRLRSIFDETADMPLLLRAKPPEAGSDPGGLNAEMTPLHDLQHLVRNFPMQGPLAT